MRLGKYRRRARRILRGLDLTYSDEPLVCAFNKAKDRGELGDLTFSQFVGCRRQSWRDRRLEARITRLSS
jgi:hypothetical protein